MKGFSKKKTTKKTEVQNEEKKADSKAILEAIDLMDTKVSAMNKQTEKILEMVGKIH